MRNKRVLGTALTITLLCAVILSAFVSVLFGSSIIKGGNTGLPSVSTGASTAYTSLPTPEDDNRNYVHITADTAQTEPALVGGVYEIRTAGHFLWMMHSNRNSSFKLFNSFVINYSGYVSGIRNVSGTIDGAGQAVIFRVDGLAVTGHNQQWAGGFADNVEASGVIKNLEFYLAGSVILSHSKNDSNNTAALGGFVGWNKGTIENCKVSVFGEMRGYNNGNVNVGLTRQVHMSPFAANNTGRLYGNTIIADNKNKAWTEGEVSLAGGTRKVFYGGITAWAHGNSDIKGNSTSFGKNMRLFTALHESMGSVDESYRMYIGVSDGGTFSSHTAITRNLDPELGISSDAVNSEGNRTVTAAASAVSPARKNTLNLFGSGDLHNTDFKLTLQGDNLKIDATSRQVNRFTHASNSEVIPSTDYPNPNNQLETFRHITVGQAAGFNIRIEYLQAFVMSGNVVNIRDTKDWNRAAVLQNIGYEKDKNIKILSAFDLDPDFVQMGVASHPFAGTINAQAGGGAINALGVNTSKTDVTGFSVTGGTANGLLGHVEGAEISNFTFSSNTSVTEIVKNDIGMFADRVVSTTFTNVDISIGGSYSAQSLNYGSPHCVGMIFGWLSGSTFNGERNVLSIASGASINVKNNNVNGRSLVGGIAGETSNTNFSNTQIITAGKITSKGLGGSFVGGFAGNIAGGSFTECDINTNTAITVDPCGKKYSAGGFAGAVAGNVSLDKCEMRLNNPTSGAAVTVGGGESIADGNIGGLTGHVVANGTLALDTVFIYNNISGLETIETANKANLVGSKSGATVSMSNVWGQFLRNNLTFLRKDNGTEGYFEVGGNAISIFGGYGQIGIEIDKETDRNAWSYKFIAIENANSHSPFFDLDDRNDGSQKNRTGWLKSADTGASSANHLTEGDGVDKVVNGDVTTYSYSPDPMLTGADYVALFMYTKVRDDGEFNRLADVVNSGANYSWLEITLEAHDEHKDDNVVYFDRNVKKLGTDTTPFKGKFIGVDNSEGKKVTINNKDGKPGEAAQYKSIDGSLFGSTMDATIGNFNIISTANIKGAAAGGLLIGKAVRTDVSNVDIEYGGLMNLAGNLTDINIGFVVGTADASTFANMNVNIDNAQLRGVVTVNTQINIGGFAGKTTGTTSFDNVIVQLGNVGSNGVEVTYNVNADTNMGGLIGLGAAGPNVSNVSVNISHNYFRAIKNFGGETPLTVRRGGIYNSAAGITLSGNNIWMASDVGDNLGVNGMTSGDGASVNKITVSTQQNVIDEESIRGAISAGFNANGQFEFSAVRNNSYTVAGWFKNPSFENAISEEEGAVGVKFTPGNNLSGFNAYVRMIGSKLKSEQDIKDLSNYVNNGNSFANVQFTLVGAMDSGRTDANGDSLSTLVMNSAFTPIGTEDRPFSGKINGAGVTLVYASGFSFTDGTGGVPDYAGLVGVLSDVNGGKGAIYNINLRIESGVVLEGKSAVGGLVGLNSGGRLGIDTVGENENYKAVNVNTVGGNIIIRGTDADSSAAVAVGINRAGEAGSGIIASTNVELYDLAAAGVTVEGCYTGVLSGFNEAEIISSSVVSGASDRLLSETDYNGVIAGFTSADSVVKDVLVSISGMVSYFAAAGHNEDADINNVWIYYANNRDIIESRIAGGNDVDINLLSGYDDGSYDVTEAISADVDVYGNISFTLNPSAMAGHSFYGWIRDMSTGERLTGTSDIYSPKNVRKANVGAVYLNNKIYSQSDYERIAAYPNYVGIEYFFEANVTINLNEVSQLGVKDPFAGKLLSQKEGVTVTLAGDSEAGLIATMGKTGVISGLNVHFIGNISSYSETAAVLVHNNYGTIKDLVLTMSGAVRADSDEITYVGAATAVNNGSIIGVDILLTTFRDLSHEYKASFKGNYVGALSGHNTETGVMSANKITVAELLVNAADNQDTYYGNAAGKNDGAIIDGTNIIMSGSYAGDGEFELNIAGIAGVNNSVIDEANVTVKNLETENVNRLATLANVNSGILANIRANYENDKAITVTDEWAGLINTLQENAEEGGVISEISVSGINVEMKNAAIYAKYSAGIINNAAVTEAVTVSGINVTLSDIDTDYFGGMANYSRNVNYDSVRVDINGSVGDSSTAEVLAGMFGELASGTVKNTTVLITQKFLYGANTRMAAAYALSGEANSTFNSWVLMQNHTPMASADRTDSGINVLRVAGTESYVVTRDSNNGIKINILTYGNGIWYTSVNDRVQLENGLTSSPGTDASVSHDYVPEADTADYNVTFSSYDLDIDGLVGIKGDNIGVENEFKNFVNYFSDENGGNFFYGIEFKLMGDITLTDELGALAIGTLDTPFDAIFNGNNHTITHEANVSGSYAGLFGYAGRYSEIKNFALIMGDNRVGLDISEYSGAVAGYLDGKLSDVVVSLKNSEDENGRTKFLHSASGASGAIAGYMNKDVRHDNVWVVMQNAIMDIAGNVGRNIGGVNAINIYGVYNPVVSICDESIVVSAPNKDDLVGGTLGWYENYEDNIALSVSGASVSDDGVNSVLTIASKDNSDKNYGLSYLNKQIKDYDDLLGMARNIRGFNCNNVTFTLANDIVIEGDENGTLLHESIGTAARPFNSFFDGNGYKITVKENVSFTGEYAGIFGYLGEFGEIKELRVDADAFNINEENAEVVSAGVVVGAAQGGLNNILVNLFGSVNSGNAIFGGVVGRYDCDTGNNVWLVSNYYNANNPQDSLKAAGVLGDNVANTFNVVSLKYDKGNSGSVAGSADWSSDTPITLTASGDEYSDFYGFVRSKVPEGATAEESLISSQTTAIMGGMDSVGNNIYAIFVNNEINTVSDYKAFANRINDRFNFSGVEYNLMGNLSMTEYISIGTESNQFRGILNGNGYTVTVREDVTYTNTAGNNAVGLINYLEKSGKIKNLSVNFLGNLGSSATGVTEYRGIVVGYLNGTLDGVITAIDNAALHSGKIDSVMGFMNGIQSNVWVNIENSSDYTLDNIVAHKENILVSGGGADVTASFETDTDGMSIKFTSDIPLYWYEDMAGGVAPGDACTEYKPDKSLEGAKVIGSVYNLIISDADDIASLAAAVEEYKEYTMKNLQFTLSQDITLDTAVIIGTSANAFDSVFNGNGKTITINADMNGTDCAGLFGYVSSHGEIKNLKVILNGSITADGSGANGAVVANNDGTITNVIVEVGVNACVNGTNGAAVGVLTANNGGKIINSWIYMTTTNMVETEDTDVNLAIAVGAGDNGIYIQDGNIVIETTGSFYSDYNNSTTIDNVEDIGGGLTRYTAGSSNKKFRAELVNVKAALTSEDDFAQLAFDVNSGYGFAGVSFTFENDIIIDGDALKDSIGNSANNFAGRVDGNGYTVTVSGLNGAIFGYASGSAALYNFDLRIVGDIELNETSGVLTAVNEGSLSSIDVVLGGGVTVSGNSVAAVAGINSGTIKDVNVDVEGVVRGVENAGGLTVRNEGAIEGTDSGNIGIYGEIKAVGGGKTYAGGVTAYNWGDDAIIRGINVILNGAQITADGVSEAKSGGVIAQNYNGSTDRVRVAVEAGSVITANISKGAQRNESAAILAAQNTGPGNIKNVIIEIDSSLQEFLNGATVSLDTEGAAVNNVWISMTAVDNDGTVSVPYKDKQNGGNIIAAHGAGDLTLEFGQSGNIEITAAGYENEGSAFSRYYDRLVGGNAVGESGGVNGALFTPDVAMTKQAYLAVFRKTLIDTEEALKAFAADVNKGIIDNDSIYELRDDITVTGDYTAIGNTVNAFNGKFNGNGYTVTLSDAAVVAGEYAGIFGIVGDNGIVANLNVKVSGDIGGDKTQYAGAVAAYNEGTIGSGTFHNNEFTANYDNADKLIADISGTITARNLAGGLIGENAAGANAAAYNVTFSGNASASRTGGAVGSNMGTVKNIDITVSGRVDGSDAAGGAIGYNGGEVANFVVNVDGALFIANGKMTGGFIGQNSSNVKNALIRFNGAANGGVSGVGNISQTGNFKNTWYLNEDGVPISPNNNNGVNVIKNSGVRVTNNYDDITSELVGYIFEVQFEAGELVVWENTATEQSERKIYGVKFAPDETETDAVFEAYTTKEISSVFEFNVLRNSMIEDNYASGHWDNATLTVTADIDLTGMSAGYTGGELLPNLDGGYHSIITEDALWGKTAGKVSNLVINYIGENMTSGALAGEAAGGADNIVVSLSSDTILYAGNLIADGELTGATVIGYDDSLKACDYAKVHLVVGNGKIAVTELNGAYVFTPEAYSNGALIGTDVSDNVTTYNFYNTDIKTESDIEQLSQMVADGIVKPEMTFNILNDIVLSEDTVIGSDESPFTATLNGNGHTVTASGAFIGANNGSIKNLIINNVGAAAPVIGSNSGSIVNVVILGGTEAPIGGGGIISNVWQINKDASGSAGDLNVIKGAPDEVNITIDSDTVTIGAKVRENHVFYAFIGASGPTRGEIVASGVTGAYYREMKYYKTVISGKNDWISVAEADYDFNGVEIKLGADLELDENIPLGNNVGFAGSFKPNGYVIKLKANESGNEYVLVNKLAVNGSVEVVIELGIGLVRDDLTLVLDNQAGEGAVTSVVYSEEISVAFMRASNVQYRSSGNRWTHSTDPNASIPAEGDNLYISARKDDIDIAHSAQGDILSVSDSLTASQDVLWGFYVNGALQTDSYGSLSVPPLTRGIKVELKAIENVTLAEEWKLLGLAMKANALNEEYTVKLSNDITLTEPLVELNNVTIDGQGYRIIIDGKMDYVIAENAGRIENLIVESNGMLTSFVYENKGELLYSVIIDSNVFVDQTGEGSCLTVWTVNGDYRNNVVVKSGLELAVSMVPGSNINLLAEATEGVFGGWVINGTQLHSAAVDLVDKSGNIDTLHYLDTVGNAEEYNALAAVINENELLKEMTVTLVSDIIFNEALTLIQTDFSGNVDGAGYSITLALELSGVLIDSSAAYGVKNLFFNAFCGEEGSLFAGSFTAQNVWVISDNANISGNGINNLVVESDSNDNGVRIYMQGADTFAEAEFATPETFIEGWYLNGSAEPQCKDAVYNITDVSGSVRAAFGIIPNVTADIMIDGEQIGADDLSSVRVSGLGRYTPESQVTVELVINEEIFVGQNKGYFVSWTRTSGGESTDVNGSSDGFKIGVSNVKYLINLYTIVVEPTVQNKLTSVYSAESISVDIDAIMSLYVDNLPQGYAAEAVGYFGNENAGIYNVDYSIKVAETVIGKLSLIQTITPREITAADGLEIRILTKEYDGNADAVLEFYSNLSNHASLSFDNFKLAYRDSGAVGVLQEMDFTGVQTEDNKVTVLIGENANYYIDLTIMESLRGEIKRRVVDVSALSYSQDYSPDKSGNDYMLITGLNYGQYLSISEDDKAVIDALSDTLPLQGSITIDNDGGALVNAKVYSLSVGTLKFTAEVSDKLEINFNADGGSFTVNKIAVDVVTKIRDEFLNGERNGILYNWLYTQSDATKIFTYVGATPEDEIKLLDSRPGLVYDFAEFGEQVRTGLLFNGSAGEYEVKAADKSDQNYEITVTGFGKFNIINRNVEISFDSRSNTHVYGSRDVAIVGSQSGGDTLRTSGEGAVKLVYTRAAGSDAGAYALTAQVVVVDGGSDVTANHNITYVDNTADGGKIINKYYITRKNVKVILDAPYEIEFGAPIIYPYGVSENGIEITGAAGVSDLEGQVISDITKLDAGNYLVNAGNIALSVNSALNYELTIDVRASAGIIVVPKKVTAIFDNVIRTYGYTDVPTLNYILKDKNGNSVSDREPLVNWIMGIYDSSGAALPSMERLASGVYDISAQFKTLEGDETDKRANYDLIIVKGKFTVNKKDITVVIGEASKQYKQALRNVPVTTDGMAYEDNINDKITFEYHYYEQIGKQELLLNKWTSNDYNVTASTPGWITITKAKITVIAVNMEKEEGTDDPLYEYVVRGTVDRKEFTGSLGREEGEKAGEYKYTQGTLALNTDYYELTFVLDDAKFTITEGDSDVSAILPLAIGIGGTAIGVIILTVGIIVRKRR